MVTVKAGRPVLALATSEPGGDVAVRRMASFVPNVVAVAPPGVANDVEAERVEVSARSATVGRAVAAAAEHDCWWVAVPKGLAPPKQMLADAVRGAGRSLDQEHPGVAFVVVDGDREHTYRRALAVVDSVDQVASGFLVWAAVGLAVHTGAELDVLLLGVDENTPLETREQRFNYLPLDRQHELLRLGLAKAEEAGVTARWIGGGVGRDKVARVREQLHTGAYDVVLDDLAGQRIRKRLGRKRDIRALLSDADAGGVPMALLESAACDVVVVIDGIRLGMLPAGVIKTGAVAALALGTLGVAAPTAASAAEVPAAATSYSAPAAVEGDHDHGEHEGHDHEGHDHEAQTATGTSAKAEMPDLEEVSADDVAKAEREATQAQKAADKADDAAKEARKDVQDAKADLQKAEKRVDALQDAASPAAQELAEARADMAAADAAVLGAQAELEEVQADAGGLTGVLPGGASSDDVAAAEQTLVTAEATAAVAHQQASDAYAAYQDFEADVAQAEARLDAAEADVADAQKSSTKAKDKADQLTQEAKQADKTEALVREALSEQGLVAPATGGVTSPYGMRVHPVTGEYKLHTGTDFEATDGNYYAAADGTVSYAGFDEAYGNMVKIDHGNVNGHHVETWYAHQPDLQVSVGDEIQAGDKLGDIGSTGYSTGPHAHFELRVDGEPIDATPYIVDGA